MLGIRTRTTLTTQDEGRVLAKAALRAADHLGVKAKTLGSVIGFSEPSVSRLKRGEFLLERETEPFELAVLFVRLYRSLDAIVGGDETVGSGLASQREHGPGRQAHRKDPDRHRPRRMPSPIWTPDALRSEALCRYEDRHRAGELFEHNTASRP